ncbi:baseplate J/gp47 family protein [Ferrovibrio xuzhouensis]|uniref:Baseplate J/gp47 family protein n=1 Tax=Ferrovibrio xuzhouensis TaxID=1576914 RepID=A0ABV7VCX3_9PROT
MASDFSRPTLTALIGRIAAELVARLGSTEFSLRRSLAGVLSRVIAEVANSLYAFIGVVARELLPDTAVLLLARHAGIWKIDRIAATYAGGSFTIAGSPDGVVLPAGQVLRRTDGIEFTVQADGVVALGTVTVPLLCSTAGITGNMDAGAPLALVSPVAGLAGTGTVAAGGLTGGAETEDIEAWRARILDRIRQPPHGGKETDYDTWIRAYSAAVTRSWPAPQEAGLGTVNVRFMMDDTYPDGIPLPADVAAAQTYMDIQRPVTAEVFVGAPNAVPIAFEIAGLQPDTPAVRTAIAVELRDLIRRETKPGGTLLISHIREAISNAAGESDHVLVTPAANVVSALGDISTFGDITWT